MPSSSERQNAGAPKDRAPGAWIWFRSKPAERAAVPSAAPRGEPNSPIRPERALAQRDAGELEHQEREECWRTVGSRRAGTRGCRPCHWAGDRLGSTRHSPHDANMAVHCAPRHRSPNRRRRRQREAPTGNGNRQQISGSKRRRIRSRKRRQKSNPVSEPDSPREALQIGFVRFSKPPEHLTAPLPTLT
jgi:hypothetical protein